jgi:choline dehydrogenase-like flavoprotein
MFGVYHPYAFDVYHLDAFDVYHKVINTKYIKVLNTKDKNVINTKYIKVINIKGIKVINIKDINVINTKYIKVYKRLVKILRCLLPRPIKLFLFKGFCETQSDIRAGTRCSTVKCYLRPALNRDNLQVTTSSVVTKVNTDM